jgi:hypothetical protein
MVITVSHKGTTRQWHVVVCRDCWRAWEALLDSATEAIQDMLRSALVSTEADQMFFW